MGSGPQGGNLGGAQRRLLGLNSADLGGSVGERCGDVGLRAHVRLPPGKVPTEKYLSGRQNVPRVADPGGQTKGHPRLWKEEV